MPSKSKREHIIESALTLFKANGIHETGIDKLIKYAGVSKKTLYNHFNTKNDLVIAALTKDDERGRKNLVEDVENSSADAIEKILNLFDLYQDWFKSEEFRGCLYINSASEFTERDDPVRQICAKHKVLIEAYIAELASHAGVDEPALLAKKLNLLLEGAIVYTYVVQDQEAARQAKVMAEMLLST
jgi:AcrR family transcriptional regulator